jgi:hypothetical protein
MTRKTARGPEHNGLYDGSCGNENGASPARRRAGCGSSGRTARSKGGGGALRRKATALIVAVAAVAGLGSGGVEARSHHRHADAASAVTATIAVSALPAQAVDTLHLIAAGGPFPYEKDGVVFGNFERTNTPCRRRMPTIGARSASSAVARQSRSTTVITPTTTTPVLSELLNEPGRAV